MQYLVRLQVVQNSAARVITRTRKFEHITPVLTALHWLPDSFRIGFKTLLLPFKSLHGEGPSYLSELLSSLESPCSLRPNSHSLLAVPRTLLCTVGDGALAGPRTLLCTVGDGALAGPRTLLCTVGDGALAGPRTLLCTVGDGALAGPRTLPPTVDGQAFCSNAPRRWNSLPDFLSMAQSLTAFKAGLKISVPIQVYSLYDTFYLYFNCHVILLCTLLVLLLPL